MCLPFELVAVVDADNCAYGVHVIKPLHNFSTIIRDGLFCSNEILTRTTIFQTNLFPYVMFHLH